MMRLVTKPHHSYLTQSKCEMDKEENNTKEYSRKKQCDVDQITISHTLHKLIGIGSNIHSKKKRKCEI